MSIKKKKIGIIDCEFGNIASLVNAVKFLEIDFKVLTFPKGLSNLTHLILPGVGSFNYSAKKLQKTGWSESIKEFVSKQKPLLGICLGMQLLFQSSSEDGSENGLGFFKEKCEKFSSNLDINLPHIGFNLVNNQKTKIWKDIPNNSPFYFIHSYRVKNINKEYKHAKTIYGEEFISFIEYENIFGAQFHPEKSHRLGLKLINNFSKLNI